MTTLFIANVGTRDVSVPDDPGSLPARKRGDAILAHWETLSPRVELPILGKALRWVARKHGPVDRVVLLGSDQPPETPAQYRDNDTLPLAQVIARALTALPDWQATVRGPEAVQVAPIPGNPAIVDEMVAYFDRLLSALDASEYSQVYLCVVGGAPAMNFGLLLKGIEYLPEKVQLLYVMPDDPEPRTLSLGRELLLESVLRDIRLGVQSYQYAAAREVVRANAGLLTEMGLNAARLEAVLDYAARRLNFDFDRARQALAKVSAEDPALVALADEIAEDRRACLREVLAVAEVSLRTGAYTAFVGYLNRLVDGLAELALARWAPGFAFVGEGSKRKIDPDWLGKYPGAHDALRRQGLNPQVSWVTLRALLAHFAQGHVDREYCLRFVQAVYEERDRRDALPLTHGCGGVSWEDARKLVRGGSAGEQVRKGRGPDEVIAFLREYFKRMAGEDAGENPYARINALLEAYLARA